MNYGVGHLSIFITKLVVICYLVYYFATKVLGLDATNLAMFASAFSIAIGFGMQSMIQNFVAGIILLGDKTIQVGDKIILSGGITGVVESITYRTTTIKTADKKP
jgi:small-conductance mechanosensitive channel